MGIVGQQWTRHRRNDGAVADATMGRGRPRRSRPRFRAVGLAVSLIAPAIVVLQAWPAAAATSISAEPGFLPQVTLGTSIPAAVRIVNQSSPDTGDSITLDSITLIPACATLDPNCAGGAQPGVFSVSPTATGETSTACAGQAFVVAIADTTTHKHTLTPTGGPAVLGAPGGSGSVCIIDLIVTVVGLPTVDSNPGLPGLQTNAIVSARGIRGGANPGSSSASGSDQVTVRAAPDIATTASPSAVVGAPIHDTATLSGGFNPAGIIRFDVFGPDDVTCTGPPVFSSVVGVGGNGSYVSGDTTTTVAGTYRWTATYSGDAANAPNNGFCNDPGESTAVRSKVVPPADFNGDGRTDVSVFRPGSGQWLVRGIRDTVWGQMGDVPVPGDYNGDGTTDLAVFRPGSGQWLVRGISDTVWGQSTDVPVPGDYNGDGTTDLAVFRPGTGQWLVRGISDTVWGQAGDVPVPGDYNGDGTTDLAVFRPGSGTWFARGLFETQYGAPNDVPLPPTAAIRTLSGQTA